MTKRTVIARLSENAAELNKQSHFDRVAPGVRTRDNVSYRSSADAQRANCEAPERAGALDTCAAVSIPKTKKTPSRRTEFHMLKVTKVSDAERPATPLSPHECTPQYT